MFVVWPDHPISNSCNKRCCCCCSLGDHQWDGIFIRADGWVERQIENRARECVCCICFVYTRQNDNNKKRRDAYAMLLLLHFRILIGCTNVENIVTSIMKREWVSIHTSTFYSTLLYTWSALHPRYPQRHLLGTPRCLQAMWWRAIRNKGSDGKLLSYLKVHITIHRHEIALVLAAPFELDNDGFAGQFIQEWLWIGGYKLWKGFMSQSARIKAYDATYGGHSIRITRWRAVRRSEPHTQPNFSFWAAASNTLWLADPSSPLTTWIVSAIE